MDRKLHLRNKRSKGVKKVFCWVFIFFGRGAFIFFKVWWFSYLSSLLIYLYVLCKQISCSLVAAHTVSNIWRDQRPIFFLFILSTIWSCLFSLHFLWYFQFRFINRYEIDVTIFHIKGVQRQPNVTNFQKINFFAFLFYLYGSFVVEFLGKMVVWSVPIEL